MERKGSKEYSIVFVVEGEKFKLRESPSSSPSLFYSRRKDCSVLKHIFLGGKETEKTFPFPGFVIILSFSG